MARSRKKHPVCGYTTAVSDRPYKKARRSGLRSEERALLHRAKLDPEADVPFDPQRWNSWASDKDGKMRVDPKSKWVRK